MNDDPQNDPPKRRRGRPRQDIGAAALNDDRPFVSSLARGMSILRAFRAEDRVLGTQAIAERTGLHKTTVSRLLGTLTKLGYLRYMPEYGKYAVSNQVLTLGYAVMGRFGFGELVRSRMEDIAAQGDCVVALSVRDRLDMMFVELIRQPAAISLSLNVGSRIPMAESAPGRAYLFAADDALRDEVLKDLAAFHGDAWKAGKEAALMAALARIRETGHSDSFGDWKPEHNAIGIPLHDPLTGDIYTLSVGGNAARLSPERLRREHLPKLLAAAQDIAALGGGAF
ncbi:IclR family transcriptional regulator [Tropicimonas sp. IMCC6043]|uniref:IclR family transcriptional regulator n=1 Tax=Tropicimonas sp. IMCC6043 TaxID=2510645 RepID=UPI00101D25D0|nr:IclR family transcriptional regulator [Tropicimonas sp. IMCC6043]RYH12286.1 IclR family transcriptional regulator [Tropicimonas sp. IMCC6043]